MKHDISIIIPFLNEQSNIDALVNKLNSYLSSQVKLDVEVIFVDDGSKDDSCKKLLQCNHEFYQAKLIRLSKNFGSHAALRAGMSQAKSSYCIFMYADLQDPLELIDNSYQKCLQGHDIVWCERIRNKKEDNGRFFSILYSKLMRKYAIENFPENGFDIIMFNEKVKDEINSSNEKDSSIFLQILSLGFKQGSISYQKKEREFGKSKWSLSKKIKLLIDSTVSFSYLPIRLVSLAGVTISILGFVWMVYIISRAIVFNDLNQGWPTLISILLLGFGITNISLGIIAEYLWRTLDASRNRKTFIIDEIKKL